MTGLRFTLAALLFAALVVAIGVITFLPGEEEAPERTDGTGEPASPVTDPGRLPEPAPETAPPEPSRAPAPGEVRQETVVIGKVLGSDGEPLVRALVIGGPAGGRPTWIPGLGGDLTGPDGTFRKEFVLGPVELWVWDAGHVPLRVPEIELEPGKTIDLGTLRLDAGLAVSGRVVDGQGRPVPHVFLKGWRTEEEIARSPRLARMGTLGTLLEAQSGEDGEWRIGGLTEEPLRVGLGRNVGLELVGEPPLVVPGTDGIRLTVRWERFAAGQVLRSTDESPVAGATVRLTFRGLVEPGRLTLTDEEGYFAFDLRADKFAKEGVKVDLTVQADGYGEIVLPDFGIADLSPYRNVKVHVTPQEGVGFGTLKGRILYDTGEPFRGSVTLSFSRSGGDARMREARTDEDGSFTVEEVPAGEYTLRTALRSRGVLEDTGHVLVIPAGGETETEFTIERGGDVDLTVESDAGLALAEIAVSLLTGEGETLARWTLGSASGRLYDLPPGRVRLRVEARGHASRTVEADVVKNSATTVGVRLPAE